MQLFYAPEVAESNYLDKIDSQHCIKVLRKQVGDIITLIDGKGNFYTAEIRDTNAKKCHFQVIEKTKEPPRDRHVHIAIAPTKNNSRTEWFVEKAVEIGVDEISFLLTKNSERKHFSLERIEKIAIAAMKQSLKATLPKLNAQTELPHFVKRNATHPNKFVAHLAPDAKPLAEQSVSFGKLVLIGPEGDFDSSELELLTATGFQQVTLGNYRLRTETAGVVACTLLNCL